MFEYGLGYLPELPSHRDHTVRDGLPREFLKAGKVLKPDSVKLQRKFSLAKKFPPIRNQYSLGACTGFSGVALGEYIIRNVYGDRTFTGSPLFTYRTTLDELGWTGDPGAFLRTTMKSMVLYGIAPEKAWPYRIANLEKDPVTRAWILAQSFQATEYYRLDDAATSPQELHQRIVANLSAGLPSAFGWPVYPSIAQAAKTGDVPYPTDDESPTGGHATVFIGWDMDRQIVNKINNTKTVGAYQCRNHWGDDWGDGGNFWLPFDYVLHGLVKDVWSLASMEWVDRKMFEDV